METILRSAVIDSRVRPANIGPAEWDGIAHVLDAMPGYALLVDEHHHIILANRTVYEGSGLTPGELLGSYCPKSIHGLEAPFAGCPVELAVAKDAAVELEFKDPRSGRWMLSGAYPTGLKTPAGRRVFLHTSRDITEKKQAQEQIDRELAERTALFALLTESLSAAPLDEFLRTSLLHLVALPWLKLESKGSIFLVGDEPGVLVMHAQHRLSEYLLTECARVKFGHCLCGRAAATGEPVSSHCLDHRHEVHYEGIKEHGHYCLPLVSPGSGVTGVLNLYIPAGHEADAGEIKFLAAVANVLAATVERKRAEARVRDYQHNLESQVAERTAQLTESYRQRRELLDIAMGHDFGTPMTVLQGYAELLRDDVLGPVPERQKKAIEAICANVQALGVLRVQMLEVSGFDRGNVALDLVDARLDEVVSRAVTDLEELIHERGLDVRMEVPDTPVHCDPDRIGQVVRTYLAGMVKYANEGMSIVVTASPEGAYLHVVFSAAGAVPVAGESLDRFGSWGGLGMALADAIVTAHHGRTWVERVTEADSRLHFTLPLAASGQR